jgi:hypothetical protein
MIITLDVLFRELCDCVLEDVCGPDSTLSLYADGQVTLMLSTVPALIVQMYPNQRDAYYALAKMRDDFWALRKGKIVDGREHFDL